MSSMSYASPLTVVIIISWLLLLLLAAASAERVRDGDAGRTPLALPGPAPRDVAPRDFMDHVTLYYVTLGVQWRCQDLHASLLVPPLVSTTTTTTLLL